MKHNYFKHLFTALLLLCTTVSSAQNFEINGIRYIVTDAINNLVDVSSRSETYTGCIVIPETVTYEGKTYSVTGIGWGAFSGCNELKSVVIPNSVTVIGMFAFHRSNNLESVIIGNGVTTIKGDAFRECYALTSIEIPSSVITIEGNAFLTCRGLKNVIIPNSVTTIGGSAFAGCENLNNVIIPSSVTNIGDRAFFGCSNLTKIEIPGSVESIEGQMFQECRKLKSVTIKDGVTNIGYSVFAYCDSLKTIEIPNSVTNIGNTAFDFCSSLESVTIGEGTEIIGDFAFRKCISLTNLIIGNNVKTIGNSAFAGCTGLKSIEFPLSVTNIKESALNGCSSLKSITIPNNVVSIGEHTFAGCSGVTSITSLISKEDLFAINSNAIINIDKNNCILYVPYGAKETYATTEGWNEFTNIVELATSEVTVTINQYGNATYCSEHALDFSEVEGLKAYNAIGYKPSTQTVTLARVMTTSAGQGVFIKGEPGEYTVPIIDNFDEYTLNLFVGTLEETTVNSTDGEMSNYKFTVADGDETPMFYPFEDNTAFSAGKAYLQIPTAWLPTTAQKSLNIRFDEGETTGVDEVKGEGGEVKTIYDLQGRIVENPTSGIYIIDGKKCWLSESND